jgi:hypothetical protein
VIVPIPKGYIPRLIPNAHHGRRAKVQIRQHVIEAITPARAIVFDAFAGAGEMWSEVWRHAADYVGVDERWHRDGRLCYAADNRRVMRCISLQRFTVFDFDAFGSPWEQAMILGARRQLEPGERLGLAITEGTWTATRLVVGGVGPKLLRAAAGMTLALQHTPGMATQVMHDDLIARALRNISGQMGGRIVKEWRAIGVTGARMRYLGVVIESLTPARSPAAAESPAGSDTRG